MPNIYDNIKNHLIEGLTEALVPSQRADICVGYFYLSGWKQLTNVIDSLSGATVREGNTDVHRVCRLLVGMQKLPYDIIKEHFSQDEDSLIDQSEVVKLKNRLAQDFKEQLTIGTPSEADENALRNLSRQMKEGKVVVKLHGRYSFIITVR